MIENVKIPEFATKTAMIDWLIANKSMLIAAKKAETKKADGYGFTISYEGGKDATNKDLLATEIGPEAVKMRIKPVINTTNILDSHKDVHIPGLWKKALQELGYTPLCREHKMDFENIITDDISDPGMKIYTKTMTWKELGYDVPGETQALIFECTIDKGRNSFMFDQYRMKYVRNHSVGMRYVRLVFCVNDQRYPEELANWNKYIDYVVNKKDAEESGYFWAVLEAKIIEGSAVVKGSNPVTGVLSATEVKTEEPSPDTPNTSAANKSTLELSALNNILKNLTV